MRKHCCECLLIRTPGHRPHESSVAGSHVFIRAVWGNGCVFMSATLNFRHNVSSHKNKKKKKLDYCTVGFSHSPSSPSSFSGKIIKVKLLARICGTQ